MNVMLNLSNQYHIRRRKKKLSLPVCAYYIIIFKSLGHDCIVNLSQRLTEILKSWNARVIVEKLHVACDETQLDNDLPKVDQGAKDNKKGRKMVTFSDNVEEEQVAFIYNIYFK
jgi:hypothetical protein